MRANAVYGHIRGLGPALESRHARRWLTTTRPSGLVGPLVRRKAKAAPAELSLDAIVSKHLAALGGADALRATRTMSYVVTGEKAGKKLTQTTCFARPGKMRVDFETEEGKASKASTARWRG